MSENKREEIERKAVTVGGVPRFTGSRFTGKNNCTNLYNTNILIQVVGNVEIGDYSNLLADTVSPVQGPGSVLRIVLMHAFKFTSE